MKDLAHHFANSVTDPAARAPTPTGPERENALSTSSLETLTGDPLREVNKAITTYTTYSPEETIELGRSIGAGLPPDSTICFFGPLAAGKTTFIKGLVEGAAQYDSSIVHSPTFTYLNVYKSCGRSVYHFDLYRLKSEEDFLSMGFEEFFDGGGICCIEWAEKIPSLLPPNSITISLQHAGEGIRTISLSIPPKSN